MNNLEPNAVTLEAVHTHTHTHTCSSRGYLEYNKIRKENIKTQDLYSIFCVSKNT